MRASGAESEARTTRGGGVRARVAALFRAKIEPRFRAEVEPRFRAEVHRRARRLLAPRATLLAEARTDADAVRIGLVDAERRAAAALGRLDRAPLSADTTVHAAHARHPGVGAVFARHGLPRCLDCAVGADETLAEAAVGEGLFLEALLKELNALPLVFR